MLSAIVAVVLMIGVFRVLPPTRELGSDAAIAAVIPAAILNWLLAMVIVALEIPVQWALAGLTLYFVVPFLWIRFGLSETYKLSALVGVVTLVLVLSVQVAFEILVLRVFDA